MWIAANAVQAPKANKVYFLTANNNLAQCRLIIRHLFLVGRDQGVPTTTVAGTNHVVMMLNF